jgi:hypothetical protein
LTDFCICEKIGKIQKGFQHENKRLFKRSLSKTDKNEISIKYVPGPEPFEVYFNGEFVERFADSDPVEELRCDNSGGNGYVVVIGPTDLVDGQEVDVTFEE